MSGARDLYQRVPFFFFLSAHIRYLIVSCCLFQSLFCGDERVHNPEKDNIQSDRPRCKTSNMKKSCLCNSQRSGCIRKKKAFFGSMDTQTNPVLNSGYNTVCLNLFNTIPAFLCGRKLADVGRSMYSGVSAIKCPPSPVQVKEVVSCCPL